LARAAACVALLMAAELAYAQSPPQPQPPQQQQPSQNPINAVGQWFENTFSFLGSGFKDARGNIDNFNREAGVAAQSATGAAKDAADAMARIPNSRLVRGHSNCATAANGAPDCSAAAVNLCKSKGHSGGTSVDFTTAEECPLQVTLGRRAAAPGECKTVTFVTRALCQ